MVAGKGHLLVVSESDQLPHSSRKNSLDASGILVQSMGIVAEEEGTKRRKLGSSIFS